MNFKGFKARLGLLFAVAALVLTSAPVRHAKAADPGNASNFILRSTTTTMAVAAGAVINSGTIGGAATYTGGGLQYVQHCVVYADNSAGGSARTLNINWIGEDGTTVTYQQAITVAIASRAIVSISPYAGTASLPTGFTSLPVRPGPRMSFQLAAAGAAAGSLAWYCTA